MTKQHAILSASSSHRWLSCPPSAKLCAALPDTSSEYAQEGTDAHELCEFKVRKALGEKVRNPKNKLQYYDSEMEDCSEQYKDFVMERYEDAKRHCPDPIVKIEERLDFSAWVPDGFGTGDCVIIADGVLQIIDFKYGQGVLVEADHNPQMMCYALGAIDAFAFLYDIKLVKMVIFQPRRQNVSTFVMDTADLLSWAEETLKPTAELAIKGEGEFEAGDHCQFCKVKATCRKRAEYNLSLAKYDFQMPAMLGKTEIAAILDKADSLAKWVKDIQEYALQQAINGEEFPGYKVVEGRSSRSYTDEAAVADAVSAAGYDPYEKKLLTITAMTSLLGKKKFEEILGGLIQKPPGKPTLVPNSDIREPINSAKDDFKDIQEEK